MYMNNNRVKKLKSVICSGLLACSITASVMGNSKDVTSAAYINELYAMLEKKEQKQQQKQTFMEQVKRVLLGIKKEILGSTKVVVRALCASAMAYRVYSYTQQPVDYLPGESLDDIRKAREEEEELFNNRAGLAPEIAAERDRFCETIRILRERRYEDYNSYRGRVQLDWRADGAVGEHPDRRRYFEFLRRELALHEYNKLQKCGAKKARRSFFGASKATDAPEGGVPRAFGMPFGPRGVPFGMPFEPRGVPVSPADEGARVPGAAVGGVPPVVGGGPDDVDGMD